MSWRVVAALLLPLAAAAGVEEVTSEAQFKKILSDNPAVVVDFYSCAASVLHRGSADRTRPSVCLAPSRPQADVRAVHHDGAHLQGGCARVRGPPQAHQGGRAALVRRSAGARPTAAAARLCLTDALPTPLHRLLSPPPLAAASAPPPSPPSPESPWPAPLPRRPRTLPLLPCSLHSA